MSFESPDNPIPTIKELKKEHKDVRDLPVVTMKKNSEGTFEMSEISEPGDKIKSVVVDAIVGEGLRDNYLFNTKKYAQAKNVKVSFEEKKLGIESKIKFTFKGKNRDIQDVIKWQKEFANLYK